MATRKKEPFLKWQDAVGIVGLLAAGATLQDMVISVRLGCYAACAVCLSVSLLFDKRWPVVVRWAVSSLVLSIMVLAGWHVWKASRTKLVRNVLIEWKQPSPIKVGTPLSERQLNAMAKFDGIEVPGIYLYFPNFGATLPAGSDTLSVEFIPRNPAEFKSAKDSIVLLVQDENAKADRQ